MGALPKGRSTVKDGVLTIQDFFVEDTGTYVCTAKNKLGSVTAVTTLGFQRKIGGSQILFLLLLLLLFLPSMPGYQSCRGPGLRSPGSERGV